MVVFHCKSSHALTLDMRNSYGSSGSMTWPNRLYLWGILGEFIAIAIVTDRYPFLYSGYVVLVSVVILIAAYLVRGTLGRTISRRPNQRFFRYFAVCAPAVFAVFAGFLWANGALDKSPPQVVYAAVVQKSAIHLWRGSVIYHLVVNPSWRAGRNDETLKVDSPLYQQANIGDTVSINLHRGWSHLSWYDCVMIRPAPLSTNR
jgi:hypothetical protein